MWPGVGTARTLSSPTGISTRPSLGSSGSVANDRRRRKHGAHRLDGERADHRRAPGQELDVGRADADVGVCAQRRGGHVVEVAVREEDVVHVGAGGPERAEEAVERAALGVDAGVEQDDPGARARTVNVGEQIALPLDPADDLGGRRRVAKHAGDGDEPDDRAAEGDGDPQEARTALGHGASIPRCLQLRRGVVMLDVAELERTLDLWASMWSAEERAQFERAVERVVDGDGPLPLKAAAVAACRIIATPRLLGAVERADWLLEDDVLEEIERVSAPRARVLRHAERLMHDRAGVTFLSTRRCAIRGTRWPTSCSIASTSATCMRS